MTRLAVTLVFDMDTDAAATLPGDPGWVAGNGEYEKPMSGVETLGHVIAQHAIRAALDAIPERLETFVERADVAVLGDD